MELTNNAPTAGTSPFSAFVTMLYEPTKTFQALESKPKTWFPLLVLIASTAGLMLWYFSIVDFAWMMERAFSTMPSAEEREQAAQFMSKNVMLSSMLGSALLGLPLMFAITGLYLMLVSKTTAHAISFGKGFGIAVWSSVPAILLLPLGAMQILMASSGQMEFSQLNPLSLNQLVFHYDMTHPLASVMDSLSVITVWNTVLMVIGFEVWAKVKRSTAMMVVLIPTLLIYGVWFAVGASKVA